MEEVTAVDDGIEEMTSNEPPNRIVVDGWEYVRRDMLEIPILKSTSDKLVRKLVEHVENGRWYYEWENISYPKDLWERMMEERIKDLKNWDEIQAWVDANNAEYLSDVDDDDTDCKCSCSSGLRIF